MLGVGEVGFRLLPPLFGKEVVPRSSEFLIFAALFPESKNECKPSGTPILQFSQQRFGAKDDRFVGTSQASSTMVLILVDVISRPTEEVRARELPLQKPNASVNVGFSFFFHVADLLCPHLPLQQDVQIGNDVPAPVQVGGKRVEPGIGVGSAVMDVGSNPWLATLLKSDRIVTSSDVPLVGVVLAPMNWMTAPSTTAHHRFQKVVKSPLSIAAWRRGLATSKVVSMTLSSCMSKASFLASRLASPMCSYRRRCP